MSDEPRDKVEEEVQFQTIAEFLENTPPNQFIHISDLSRWKQTPYGAFNNIRTPELQLHCDNDKCNGIRFFRCVSGGDTTLNEDKYKFFFLTYICSNCQQVNKTFSLAAKIEKDQKPNGVCYKYGELPPYGPPVSPKLIKLIGPDRDEFLKGRRCENQGLGVGAFIYYRRVVENQKNRILGDIIKVLKKINVSPEKVEILENAIRETQFTKALEMAKDALPESLLINGHSPISLLHSALSKGVHELTDEDCLDLAGSIRVVLGELSERLSQALKDEAKLTKALSTLMSKKKNEK